MVTKSCVCYVCYDKQNVIVWVNNITIHYLLNVVTFGLWAWTLCV
jgi:hypothetical protein